MEELLKREYSQLWRLDFDALENEAAEVTSVINLAKKLKDIYRKRGVTPTNTLVTKVLLGTLGCIPAYDTLFTKGVKNELCKEFSYNLSPVSASPVIVG